MLPYATYVRGKKVQRNRPKQCWQTASMYVLRYHGTLDMSGKLEDVYAEVKTNSVCLLHLLAQYEHIETALCQRNIHP